MDRRWFLLAWALLASTSICAEAWAQTAERPTRNVGDNWTYRYWQGGVAGSPSNWYYVRFWIVTKVDAKGYELSWVETAEHDGAKTKGTGRRTPDSNWFARATSGTPWTEVVNSIWPLRVGQKWNYEIPVSAGTEFWEARVVAWDDIEVPAGKFKALRVEHEMVRNPNPLVWRKDTWWYSPDAKNDVKFQYHTSYEGSFVVRRDLSELQSYMLR